MSNIHVRNVIGTGPFTLPTSGTMLDAASSAWRSILSSITNLSYSAGYAMVMNTPGSSEEEVLVVENWNYLHDICNPESTVEQLRQAIRGALSLHPNVTSFGAVDISMLRQGAFYEQAPRVSKLDYHTGTVYFEDRIPPGAQIEVYKFTRHKKHPDHDQGRPFPPRLGHRYRPDRILAVGATSWTVPDALLGKYYYGRQHFKFAYRWPAAPGTPAPAPGIRGPLSPTGISTGSAGEISHTVRIILCPSPRRPLSSDL